MEAPVGRDDVENDGEAVLGMYKFGQDAGGHTWAICKAMMSREVQKLPTKVLVSLFVFALYPFYSPFHIFLFFLLLRQLLPFLSVSSLLGCASSSGRLFAGRRQSRIRVSAISESTCLPKILYVSLSVKSHRQSMLINVLSRFAENWSSSVTVCSLLFMCRAGVH